MYRYYFCPLRKGRVWVSLIQHFHLWLLNWTVRQIYFDWLGLQVWMLWHVFCVTKFNFVTPKQPKTAAAFFLPNTIGSQIQGMCWRSCTGNSFVKFWGNMRSPKYFYCSYIFVIVKLPNSKEICNARIISLFSLS